MFHVVVKFSYNELLVDGLYREEDPGLIRVPRNAVVVPEQVLSFDRTATRDVDLFIDPSLVVIGEYLELTRLAISDVVHQGDFPLGAKSVEVLYSDFLSIPWERDTNVYFHEGYLLVNLTAYVSRGWRDKFRVPVNNINLDLNTKNIELSIEPTN